MTDYNPTNTTSITTRIIEAVKRSDADFTEMEHNPAGCGFQITAIYGEAVKGIFAEYNANPTDYVLDLAHRGTDAKWFREAGIEDALSVMDAPSWDLTGELGQTVLEAFGRPDGQ